MGGCDWVTGMGEPTSVDLGGCLNSGYSWTTLLLYGGAAVALSAGIGGFVLHGKRHSELKQSRLAQQGARAIQGAMGQQVLRSGTSAQRSAQSQTKASQQVDIQDIMQHYINTAMELQHRGMHVEAADAFKTITKLLRELDGTSAESQNMIMQFQLLMYKELVTACEYRKACEVYQSIPFPKMNDAETFSRLIQLSDLLLNIPDERCLDILAEAEEVASYLPNKEILNATLNKLRGRYFCKVGANEKAESYFRNAIAVHVEEHKKSGASELSKDALSCYFEIQKMLISQGKPTLALNMNDDEISQLTSMKYEDISFYWHLTHLAYILVEYDYTQFAEQLWKKVFAMYENKCNEVIKKSKSKRTNFEKRVFSIVSNAKNELSVLYYNQGKRGFFTQIQTELQKLKLPLDTNSKFYDSSGFNILFGEDPQGFATVHFILKLKVRNHSIMTQVTGIRFHIEYEGTPILRSKCNYDPDCNLIVLTSPVDNHIEIGTYGFVVETLLDGFDGEEIYTHFNFIYCGKHVPPNTPASNIKG